MVDTIKKYEDQRIKEVLLYILNKTGVVDYYHLMKILYLAERQHLAKWGEKSSSLFLVQNIVSLTTTTLLIVAE